MFVVVECCYFPGPSYVIYCIIICYMAIFFFYDCYHIVDVKFNYRGSEDCCNFQLLTSGLRSVRFIHSDYLLSVRLFYNNVYVRGSPWSAANRLHGQQTGAFS